MGDEVLKKLILALLLVTFCFSALNADSKYKEYDDLFNAINKERKGISEKDVDKTENPFVSADKSLVTEENNNSKASKEEVYVLKGILNNSANINGNWYKLNEKIGEFTILKIKENSVIIGSSGSSLELKLYEGNKNVIITTK